jgi:hypothetical protein
MRVTAVRIRDGKALREAMQAKHMTLIALAARTRELDPDGKGVSYQLIGFLTAPPTGGMSGTGANRARRYRTSTSPATAGLIEQALDVRPGELFTREEVPEPGDPVPADAPPPVPKVRFADPGDYLRDRPGEHPHLASQVFGTPPNTR